MSPAVQLRDMSGNKSGAASLMLLYPGATSQPAEKRPGKELCIRARLHSCRKGFKIDPGFSPCARSGRATHDDGRSHGLQAVG